MVEAGRAQVLSAGSGIRHSEVADPGSGRCRFVQAWLAPTRAGGEPAYVLGEAPPPASGLVEVAGGSGLPIGVAGARLLVARLAAGESVDAARRPAPARLRRDRSVSVAGSVLRAGDAARISDEPGHVVRASEPTELLVWSFA